MANLNVTYAELQQVSNQLNSGHGELTQILTQLKSAVDSLVAAGFQTDQASGAFHNSYTQFNTGVNQTLEGLVGMSQYLTKAQEAMADLDSQLASAAQG